MKEGYLVAFHIVKKHKIDIFRTASPFSRVQIKTLKVLSEIYRVISDLCFLTLWNVNK